MHNAPDRYIHNAEELRAIQKHPYFACPLPGTTAGSQPKNDNYIGMIYVGGGYAKIYKADDYQELDDPRLRQEGCVPPPPPPPEPPESDFNILGLYPGLESLNEKFYARQQVTKPKPLTSYGALDYGFPWWVIWSALWIIVDLVLVGSFLAQTWPWR